MCLENLRRELSAQHESELQSLRSQFEKESAEHEAEVERLSQARSQAEREHLRRAGSKGTLGFPAWFGDKCPVVFRLAIEHELPMCSCARKHVAPA